MANVFSHAGVSRKSGKLKVRWANGIERVKMLIKDGQTDIDLIELMSPMSKEDAVLSLLNMNFAAGNLEVQATLEAEAVKRGIPGYTAVVQTEGVGGFEAEEDPAVLAEIEADILASIEVEILQAAEEDNVIVLDAEPEVKSKSTKKRPAVTAFETWAEAAADATEEEAA